MEVGISHWLDILVIVIYFVFVFIVGVLSMCRKNRESLTGYFLAGRSMNWVMVGASLFASNIGSEHFIGLAGSGAAAGIAVVAFEWGAVFLLLLLGWVFLPIYLTANVFTIPEYLKHRFGGQRLRVYFSIVALCLYVLSKISVDVYAGALFIQQALGWDLYVSMIPLLTVTALYTIAGGLAAVVFTDTLQTVVMLVGAVILAIMAFIQVGGIEGLFTKYMEAVPTYTHNVTYVTNASMALTSSNVTCGLPRADAFHIFRDPVNSDLPWPGVLIRSTVASLWNWCADQVMVQRALGAKNMAHAKGATILAGYLKFLPLFLIIMPGMISRILYPEEVACNVPEVCERVCGNPVGCSNVAYPQLVLRLAPIGMRGLLMAVMVAALMSSLTSIFNSAGTVFTMDLWLRLRPLAKERELLIVGRAFVLVLVTISILWIPLIFGSQEGQLFLYIQSVTGYVAPPICAIFILAVAVPRLNEQGAFWGTVAGQLVGLTRLVLDFIYRAPGCGQPDTRPALVSKVHFTYFSGIVLVVTAVVALVVSFFTAPPDPKKIYGLTWWTVYRRDKGLDEAGAKDAENGKSSVLALSKDLEMQRGLSAQREPDGEDSKGEMLPKATTGEDKETNSDQSERCPVETTDSSTPKIRVFSLAVPSPWNVVLDLNACVLLVVAAFLYGIFA